MRTLLFALLTLGLASMLAAQTSADSVTVTFRYYGVPWNNTFVPGEFNAWGGNVGGVITPPGNGSMMTYDSDLQCWVKTYVFKTHAAGRWVADSVLAYKFNSNGCNTCWVADPLNPEVQPGDANGNSILRLSTLRWFEPYAYASGTQVTAFALSLIHANSDSITKITFTTGTTPLGPLTTRDITAALNRSMRTVKTTLPVAVAKSDYIRVVAYSSGGDSVVYAQGGYAVAHEARPAYAQHGVTPGSPASGDSITFRLRISGMSYVLVRIAPEGQEVATAPPVLMRLDPDLKNWWTNVALPAGTYEYKFELENGTQIYDPWGRDVGERGSRFTVGPQGRTADDYVWSSGAYQRPPLNKLVIYELNVGEFAGGYFGKTNGSNQGTLQELTTLLPYFDSLGVNAIELMPVMDYGTIGRSGHSWGYDLNTYFAIEPGYGTPRDLKALVDSAHTLGIAIILDVVFNHLNETSALWQMQPDVVANPYFKANNDLRPNEDQLFFFKDLDHWAPETQEIVLASLKMWIDDYHVDGFRYDFTQGIGWSTSEPTKGILGWANKIDQDYNGTIYQIAEHLPESPALLFYSGMTSGWHDSFRDRVFDEARFRTVSLSDIESLVLDLGAFAGNDSPSIPNRYADRTGPVNATITHDEQSLIFEMTTFHGVSISEAVVRDKLYGSLIFTSLGIPMLWQGQEFSEPRGWSSDGLKLSYRPVDWTWLSTARGSGHFDYYHTLIMQRRYNPALYNGALYRLAKYESGQKVLVWGFVDSTSGAKVVIAANFGGSSQNISNVPWLGPDTWYDVFDQSSFAAGAVLASLTIPAYGARIFSNRTDADLGIITSVNRPDADVPSTFSLRQNYPNPFNPWTIIPYDVPVVAHQSSRQADGGQAVVSLKVYDALGREIATLVNGVQQPGYHQVTWNAGAVPSGVYFYRLAVNGAMQTRRMIVLK